MGKAARDEAQALLSLAIEMLAFANSAESEEAGLLGDDVPMYLVNAAHDHVLRAFDLQNGEKLPHELNQDTKDFVAKWNAAIAISAAMYPIDDNSTNRTA